MLGVALMRWWGLSFFMESCWTPESDHQISQSEFSSVESEMSILRQTRLMTL